MIGHLLQRRGTATVQTVVLLSVGMAILFGLRAVSVDATKHVTSKLGDTAAGSATAGRPAAAPVASRPALTPEAEAAQRRLDQLPHLAMSRDLAEVAYLDKDDPKVAAFKARYPGWNVNFWTVPGTGMRSAYLTATDPNDKRVYVAFGGTEPGNWRHWAVNLGQHLPHISTTEALAKVGLATAAKSIPGIALATLEYGLSTIARTDYDGVRQVGAAMKQRFGAENVTLVGHSKGGGEATFAGATNGLRTYTFNTAGISEASLDLIRTSGVKNPEKYVTNIVSEGDVVSVVDVKGTKLGDTIIVEPAIKSPGPRDLLHNHGIANVQLDKPVSYEPAKPLPR